MRSSIYAFVAAAFAGLTAAYHAPVGNPNGNAIIKPGLQEQVPAGKPYTITWTPTTPKTDTISLILLRGPSTNIQYLSTIVEGIQNTGSYVWTPSTDLEADTTHYGMQLILDSTGQYQYSTQFGISNDKKTTSSTTAAVSQISDGQPQGPTGVPSYTVAPPVTPSTIPSSSVAAADTSQTTSYAPSVSGAPGSTGGVPYTILTPTNGMSVPATLKTTAAATPTSGANASFTATTSPAAISTGAAVQNLAGNVAVAAAGLVGTLWVAL